MDSLIPPQDLRKITLALAAAEAGFCAFAIVASAFARGSDPTGGISSVLAIGAIFTFMVLTLPAGLFAWYWRYLPIAAAMAVAAGVVNSALLLIWAL